MLKLHNLSDSAVTHSPSAWEELALSFEKKKSWDCAMKAWQKAASASAGHNRRARYDERATTCARKAYG